MGQSLSQLYVHAVFSTKRRRPFLQDETIRGELHGYLAGTCRNLECPSLIVGGVEDHVHILCMLSKNIASADFIRELKRESSKWLKPKASTLREFQWQQGYGLFSVSPSHVGVLKNYIATQAAHHARETFKEEFLRLLQKYDVSYDEQYLWD